VFLSRASQSGKFSISPMQSLQWINPMSFIHAYTKKIVVWCDLPQYAIQKFWHGCA
jgi:hypothetical protein